MGFETYAVQWGFIDGLLWDIPMGFETWDFMANDGQGGWLWDIPMGFETDRW